MAKTANDATTTTPAATEPSPWMTVPEAAAYLKVCDKSLYREIASGRLKALRLRSRAFRVRRDWLDAWLLDSGMIVNPDAPGVVRS